MHIRVVLKQYSGESFPSIFKEIKIFTLHEQQKKEKNADHNTLSAVLENSKTHDGMPELLGYTI